MDSVSALDDPRDVADRLQSMLAARHNDVSMEMVEAFHAYVLGLGLAVQRVEALRPELGDAA